MVDHETPVRVSTAGKRLIQCSRDDDAPAGTMAIAASD
jgi:hypothetical protein